MKNKLTIFNILSIIFLCSIVLFFAVRFVYYKLDYKKDMKYSKVLSERIIEEDNNYELTAELIKINKLYYFYGKSRNNYVNYKNLIWRIVKINKDKSITLILDNSINNMPYESTMKWLNKGNEEHTGIFYDLLCNKKKNNDDTVKYNSLDNKNNLYCDKLEDDRIYLLDEEDYVIAGAEDSYLNNKSDFWLNNNKYVENDGIIETEKENEYHTIRPVIILDSKTKISKGNGSIDDPYYIKRDEVNSLKDVNAFSYIKYNNTVWKIIDVYEDKIKIASTECIKDKNGKCLSYIYSDDTNKATLYNPDSLLYYLNSTYYNGLENKNYLTDGHYYVGKYENNDYLTIFNETKTLTVGLLTMADSYPYEIDNTFILTTNKNSDRNIFISLDNKPFESLISEEANIRPVLHLKNNISIKSGDGTYLSPYILGGIEDEEK